MTGATRKGDLTEGPPSHPWIQTPSTEGSPDVMVDGKPVVRVGDHYATHVLPNLPILPHDSVSAQGSQTVFANYKAVTRIGDQTSCSDFILEGSSDVIVGDGPFPMSVVVEPGVTLIGGAKTYDDSTAGINAHVRDESAIAPTFPDHGEESAGTIVPEASPAITCSNFGDVITAADMGQKVSKYFLLANCMATTISGSAVGNQQLTASQVACNWVGLCDALLDPIYDQYQFKINSGFRSPAYNAGLVARGYHPSKTSDHLRGCAADLIMTSQDDTIALFKWILTSGLPFSQIIFETTWVHVSYNGKDHSQDIFRVAYSLDKGASILAGGNKGELLPPLLTP